MDQYLDHLQVERMVSPNTLDGYRRDLTALASWADANGHDLLRLGAEDIRAFVAAEHRRGLSPKSLQRRLSAVRSFYRWLLKNGRIAASPAAAIRAPKAPRKLPQVLDPDEAKVLVEVPTDVPLGLRDRALLELFYSSGLRLSELCALRWRDLDLDDGLVTVLGKGNKQRSVPVGSHARNALTAWRADTGAGNDAPVFPGRHGPITPRRSPEDSSTWLANECRNRCGCTRLNKPWRWASWRRRSCTARGVIGPWRPGKTGASLPPPVSLRHAASALRACEPTGTLRCLLPLPSTVTSPLARSRSRQRSAHSSDRRSPDE